MRIDEEKLMEELHRRFGRCTHCGKTDCAGKASGSKLPARMLTEGVMAAIDAAKLLYPPEPKRPPKPANDNPRA